MAAVRLCIPDDERKMCWGLEVEPVSHMKKRANLLPVDGEGTGGDHAGVEVGEVITRDLAFTLGVSYVWLRSVKPGIDKQAYCPYLDQF